MANKLITQYCPHCKRQTVEIDPKNAYALAPACVYALAEIDGNNGAFKLPIHCTSCGWAGEEVWAYHYSFTKTTFSPKPKEIVPTVQMFEVDSSVIKSVGYDRAYNTLYVQFLSNNKVYAYKNVDSATFVDFLNADSKGRYYSRNIKGVYETL